MVQGIELRYNKGEPVILRDNRSQIFIGEVKAINEKLGRIVLKDVIQLPEHIIIPGYRNFDREEILELRSANFKEIIGDCVESSSSDVQDPTTSTTVESFENKEAEKVKYTIIKDLNSDFHSAISDIKSFSRIGLMVLDSSKGRQKRATVVAVSTPTEIFIFDLFAVGDDVFVKGLGEVLQSPTIEKIVHDSRLISDCLKKKHAVNLENVRDLEAEDIMMVYQERKTIRRHRRTLKYLIEVYLKVRIKDLDKVEDWTERPLKENHLEDLAKVISYLIPLQEAIERQYLSRLISASRVYNTYVRELDLCDFLHYVHEKTLRKEMIEIVAPKNEVRGDGRP